MQARVPFVMTSTSSPVRAYVLINTKIGKSAEVIEHLKQIEGIIRLSSVTGTKDIIAVVVTATLEQLHDIIEEIHKVPDILETETQVVLKEVT